MVWRLPGWVFNRGKLATKIPAGQIGVPTHMQVPSDFEMDPSHPGFARSMQMARNAGQGIQANEAMALVRRAYPSETTRVDPHSFIPRGRP